MDLNKIKQVIDAMAASDLTELELIEDTWTLRLSRAATTAPSKRVATAHDAKAKLLVPAARPAEVATNVSPTIAVLAPLSGVVYLQPGPEKPPFVTVGQAITAGTPVCVIEAMKVFNEVSAESDGVVEAILVSSGFEIDAGQPLLRLVRQAA